MNDATRRLLNDLLEDIGAGHDDIIDIDCSAFDAAGTRLEGALHQAEGDRSALTGHEHNVLAQLAGAYQSFEQLDPPPLRFDHKDFSDAIHACQRIVGFRVARRSDSGYWGKS